MKKFVKSLITATVFISSPLYAADLKISSEVMYKYCTEYFGLVNVSFENKSEDWIDVRSVNVSFGRPDIDKKVVIVSGERLLAWNEGITAKLQNDAFYSRLLLGTVAAIGSSIYRQNGNDAARAVALGSAGILTIKELMSTKDAISLGQVVPRTHLLSGSFSIPPDLTASRWILFNTKKNDGVPFLMELEISLALNNGETQTEKTRFRYADNSCSWQSSISP